MKEENFFWGREFPPIFNHTSVSFLKKCTGFYEAKGGNMECARRVVDSCVKQKRLEELRIKFPNAELLPVISNNKLPLALCEKIGLKTCLCVRRISQGERKKMSGAQRLKNHPKFVGIIDKTKNYIIVDDIVAQGGTIASLRRFILSQGASVCAVAALAHTKHNGFLNPQPELLIKLFTKFSKATICSILREHKIVDDVRELTVQQIDYLLRFNKAVDIDERLRSVA